MSAFFRKIFVRVVSAYLVLTGRAVPIYLGDSDTTILVVETEGSNSNYVSCRNFIQEDSSYNILLSKIFLWGTSKNRFFWTADNLGSQIKALAEESFEEHKNKQ
jgi:hypothetical protein